jgi:hypothetical protein
LHNYSRSDQLAGFHLEAPSSIKLLNFSPKLLPIRKRVCSLNFLLALLTLPLLLPLMPLTEIPVLNYENCTPPSCVRAHLTFKPRTPACQEHQQDKRTSKTGTPARQEHQHDKKTSKIIVKGMPLMLKVSVICSHSDCLLFVVDLY